MKLKLDFQNVIFEDGVKNSTVIVKKGVYLKK